MVKLKEHTKCNIRIVDGEEGSPFEGLIRVVITTRDMKHMVEFDKEDLTIESLVSSLSMLIDRLETKYFKINNHS